MSFPEKIALAAALSFPVILPFMVAKFGAGRFSQPKQKFGYIARVAAISYCLAIALAFFISTMLRTFAPSIVTGREPVAPLFNFLSEYELAMTVCMLALSAIGASVVLLPKRRPETEVA